MCISLACGKLLGLGGLVHQETSLGGRLDRDLSITGMSGGPESMMWSPNVWLGCTIRWALSAGYHKARPDVSQKADGEHSTTTPLLSCYSAQCPTQIFFLLLFQTKYSNNYTHISVWKPNNEITAKLEKRKKSKLNTSLRFVPIVENKIPEWMMAADNRILYIKGFTLL